MFCKNCGKELNDNSKFCMHCGTNLEENTIHSSNTESTTINKKKKPKITVKILLFLMFCMFFSIAIDIAKTQKSNTIEQILDVNQFYKTATQTITVDELIAIYGEPEKREEWNYTNSQNTQIPLLTLFYEDSTYEYVFYDNMLARINIYKPIKFNNENDLFKLFNLTKHDITTIKNINSAIRIYNSSVPDFWCGFKNKTTEWIKITYNNNIFQ